MRPKTRRMRLIWFFPSARIVRTSRRPPTSDNVMPARESVSWLFKAQDVPDLSIHADAVYMLDLAALVYLMATLRDLVRTGNLPEGDQDGALDRIRNVPILPSDLLKVLNTYEAELTEEFSASSLKDRAGVQEFRDVLQRMVERQSEPWVHGQNDNFSVQHFEDERSDSEPVYAISIDHFRRRVTVAFRGSVTLRDWKANFTPCLKPVSGPSISNAKRGCGAFEILSEYSRIHWGLHSYLFGRREEDGETVFTRILGQVRELLKEHRGYQVCATGHSLGGALSTVFAYWAANSASSEKGDTVDSPLLNISFGSPKVGNDEFAQDFWNLERSGRLRCLRVVNCGDVIAEHPVDFYFYRSPRREIRASGYCYIGNGLYLCENPNVPRLWAYFSLSLASNARLRSGLWQLWPHCDRKCHSWHRYHARLKANEQRLSRNPL